MATADVTKMRAALFVEIEGDTFLVALPFERMKLLLPMAAALFDDGKLALSPTTLFNFNDALERVMAPHGDEGQMRAAFYEWVEEQGCDSDGAWSAWQGCWGLLTAKEDQRG